MTQMESLAKRIEDTEDVSDESCLSLGPNKITRCEECKKNIHVGSYKRHLELHRTGPSKCELCDSVAKNSESLRLHMYYMHRNNAKQYHCSKCDKFFRYKYRYDLHLKTAHGGQKTKMCETCAKTFFTVRELNKHVQSIHMKSKPHICPYCHKGFATLYSRKTHLKQHTNERPYKYHICSDAFRQKVSLKGHLKSKHDNADLSVLDPEPHNEESSKGIELEQCDIAPQNQPMYFQQLPISYSIIVPVQINIILQ